MTYEEILKRLEEIEARAAKATPGPWEVRELATDSYDVEGPKAGWEGFFARRGDAEFIAACREDNPWLCKVARKLLGVAEAARELKKTAVIVSPMQIGTETFLTTQYVGIPRQQWDRLKRALAALEEEG